MAGKRTGPDIHVVPTKSSPGKFVAKEARNPRPITRPASQTDTVRKAIPIAKANRSEVVIYRRDGTIRDNDGYGNDPNPPRDRKH